MAIAPITFLFSSNNGLYIVKYQFPSIKFLPKYVSLFIILWYTSESLFIKVPINLFLSLIILVLILISLLSCNKNIDEISPV